MTSISRDDLPIYGFGEYSSQEVKWNGFTVAYESTAGAIDAVERFQTLLDGGCKCPHWGYQISGASTYVYDDHEETFHAGDFFYIAPGHSPRHAAGSQWVCFSPTEQHEATQALSRGSAQA